MRWPFIIRDLVLPHHDTPNSLWMAGLRHTLPNSPLTQQTTSDVTVIGAGFTGLRAAHKLADAGKRVVVLDANDVGFGASGRNGGQVNPILPFNGPEQVRRHVGPTYLQRLTDISLGSADSLFDFINQYQIKCDARQHGWLRVDHCERAKKESRKNAEAWIKLGAQIEFVDGEALTTLTGSSAYQSGILVPRGGAVQPLALVHGIAERAKSAGATIYGYSAANRLTQQPDGWTVETASGSVTSQWVILATNGYTDTLYKHLKASIIPFVSVQIATPQLPPEVINTILPQGHTIADTRRVIIYARREPDDRIVIGSHGNIRNDDSLTGFDWLKNDAERIFPQLKGIDWEYAWGGKIAVTDDRLPHFHEPATGLVAGMGYNGRGVAMSNAMGTVLADRVLGTAPEDLPFPISRIKKIPFRNVQLLGKRTVVWWMQQLDKREL
jgi:sarcosine oxidase